MKAGVAKGRGLAGQQRRVRGEREISNAGDRSEHAHELFDVAAQQRLAPGQPDLLHAMRDEDARQPRYFLKAEQLRCRHECVAAAEDRFRHAIRAAEIAAVGDRDAQIAKRAGKGVGDGVAHRKNTTLRRDPSPAPPAWSAPKMARPPIIHGAERSTGFGPKSTDAMDEDTHETSWWTFSIDESVRSDPARSRFTGELDVNPELPDGRRMLDYHAYLGLDQLLASQRPSSSIPDERVFIITHQLHELAFKMVAFDFAVIARTLEALIASGDADAVLRRSHEDEP